MTFDFFRAPEREPSQLVGFSGNTIERLSENRSDDSVETALRDGAARIMLMRDGRVLLRMESDAAEPFQSADDARQLQARLNEAVLLGWASGAPVLAVPADIEPDALPSDIKAIDYRSVYMQGLLDAQDLGALAQGAALLAWNANHRFCGRCGRETDMRAGGYKRVCGNCGAQHFPRTDPVAIMLAIHGEHCLLGRSPHFAPGMYSCLAGFIEPGETIENAVRREIFEESGIRVGRVAYHASQPWPFPYSLMIGCFGEALSDRIDLDREELEDCRWVSRAELRDMIAGRAGTGLTIPPPGAIASHLIKAWAEAG